jgi:hypothetical protein
MATTSKIKDSILEVLANPPSIGLAAKARAIYRVQKYVTGSYPPESLRKWSEKAQEEIEKCSANAREAMHPLQAMPDRAVQKMDKLSPSDLIWIQRLPTDPAKIPFQDAARLGQLAKHVADASDRNLLQSVWLPVKEHHDRRQAEALAHNANLAPANLFLESVQALGDIIRNEMPTLSQAGAEEEARELIRQAETRRRNYAAAALARVDAIKAEADKSEAKRTALVND